MYKKKKKDKLSKKIIIPIVSIVIFILLFISVQLNRNTIMGESIFKDTTMFINRIVMYPFTSLNNKKDINQSESYVIQKNVNESLEKEIQELKEQLNLNKTLTEYDTINATILSRNKSYWFNTITIDKGRNSGIKKDMAVVTSGGLIGKISKVYKYSSEIKLITSDDINYKVSVAIKSNSGDSYAILNGYDKKTNTIKVSGVDNNNDIKEGDNIVTSGLGGMFPGGIYIGEVTKQESDKYNLSKTLYIKTKQDFNSIHYVTILKEKE
ncbi:MAG: rod shape-determining protein MreC [Bacilli bacterium]|nr:rod shape-determining protein MreC [Bacilli bacterium]